MENHQVHIEQGEEIAAAPLRAGEDGLVPAPLAAGKKLAAEALPMSEIASSEVAGAAAMGTGSAPREEAAEAKPLARTPKAEARRLARLARKQEAAAAQQAQDEAFMRLALEEAQLAAQAGEVPIGAVVVHQPHDRATGKPTAEPRVIARGHNQCELLKDASAHAEFSAMREAEQALGNWRLSDCTIYVTLEPCVMCAGLMHRSRVGRCVYGAPDPKGGALGSLYAIHQDRRLNHRFPVTAGILEEECQALLQRFFQTRR
ncbi:tRNA adenosine(34) deaminase TadA [Parvibacter caecicola]|uniref:tRNA adenosine(34) deaminase TadA n=1 Tax=Parvibacter caecicola TaxID=747645 RepID=UPI002731D1FA|nr:tRNA adenosine(34) deaminase TadA [Parvibacter caecicola]